MYKYVKDVEECCKKADIDQAQKKQKAGWVQFVPFLLTVSVQFFFRYVAYSSISGSLVKY